jgi:hypothetical protein
MPLVAGLLRLPADILLRLCSEGDWALSGISSELRRALPRCATSTEAFALAAAAPAGTAVCQPVPSHPPFGKLRPRAGLLVRCLRIPRDVELPLYGQSLLVASLVHGDLRDGRSDWTPACLWEALMANDETTVRAGRYAGQLAAAFPEMAKALNTHFALCEWDDHPQLCSIALSAWPLGMDACCQALSLMARTGRARLGEDAEEATRRADAQKATIVAAIGQHPSGAAALRCPVSRAHLATECIESGFPLMLAECLRDATVMERGAAALHATYCQHAECLRVALQTMDRTSCPELIAQTLCAAAENNDLECCTRLLAHGDQGTDGARSAGDALVACSRLNRTAAAVLLCTGSPRAPAAALGRAIQVAAHWGFSPLLHVLLAQDPPCSVDALTHGLWAAAFRGHADIIMTLRSRLSELWNEYRQPIQEGLDQALEAASTTDSVVAALALLAPPGPTPGPGAQANAMRRACFVGSAGMMHALFSQPLTRAMNGNTLRACFLESTRRHDLPTVRAMLPLAGAKATGDALEIVMAAGDVELTAEILHGATPSLLVLQRAVCTAFAQGGGSTIAFVANSFGSGVNRREGWLGALSDAVAMALQTAAASRDLGRDGHARRSLSAVLSSAAVVPLMAAPGAWRAALKAVLADAARPNLGVLADLHVLVEFGPTGMDWVADDVDAARESMPTALKMRNSGIVRALTPLFVQVARSRDVDAAFLVAVAWPNVPSMQLLSRHFAPSRDCLRRCRVVLASSKSPRDKDELGQILSQLSRSPSKRA